MFVASGHLGNIDTTETRLVVFKDGEEKTKLSLITVSSMRSEISRRSVRIGISSLMAKLKATHSAAVELKVMSVCSLLDQTMGQLKRVRENPVLDLTLTGS